MSIPVVYRILLPLLFMTALDTRAQSANCDLVDSLNGVIHELQRNEPERAFKLAQEFIELANECDGRAQVMANVRMSGLLDDLGEFEAALEYAEKAYVIARKLDDPESLVRANAFLAQIYTSSDHMDLATKFGRNAIKVARKGEVREMLATLLINQGFRLFASHPDSALHMMKEAERIAMELGQYQYLNNARMNLVSMHAQRGDFKNAKASSLRLLKDSIFLRDRTSAFYTTLNLGYIYNDLAKPDSYAIFIKQARRMLGNWSSYEEQMAIEQGMYNLYNDQKVYDSALFYFQRLDSIKDTILGLERVQTIAQMREMFEADLREQEIEDLEQENEIASLQRNLFIIIALALLMTAIAVALIYTNRLRTNKLLTQQRIDQLEKEKEVLSLQSMLVAQEEERQRIARDLHDSIGALLSAAKLHITNIVAEVKKLEELDFLKSTEEAIDRANSEVRRVAHDMMPGVLMKLGLTEGIEDFIDRVRKSSRINVSFTYDELPERLENKREVMLYRIVQELVNNTIKHAQASEIKIMLKLDGQRLVLDYRDDGRGFDAQALNDQDNFGLSGLKSRVNFLEGSLELETDPGKGVHYRFEIPMK